METTDTLSEHDKLAHYLRLRYVEQTVTANKYKAELKAAAAAGSPLTPMLVAKFGYVFMQDDATDLPIWPAPHHWAWLQLLCNTSIKRLLIIAPPESAKTTWVSAYIACSMGLAPVRPRILAAVAGVVAEKRSVSIRSLVTSPLFEEVFPNVAKEQRMKWSSTEWSLYDRRDGWVHRLHPTLFSVGQGGSITGARAWEAIADDLLDYDSTRTAHQRELSWQWFQNSFMTRLMSRVGRAIVIGTAWHHNDLYKKLEATGEWVVARVPLLSPSKDVRMTIYYPPDVEHKMGEAVSTAS